jgi:hypothetical protein
LENTKGNPESWCYEAYDSPSRKLLKSRAIIPWTSLFPTNGKKANRM